MSYYHPYYTAPYYTPHPPPTNWPQGPGQPTSAPPASGGGSAIQFGSLHPTQVEALQYGHHQPMYHYPPAAYHMMPQYAYPVSHMGPPPNGSQPHVGVQHQRDGRSGMRQSRGGGRAGGHMHRERPGEQRETGQHRETPHHKTATREPPQQQPQQQHGHPPPPSRSGTPTSQQQQHREGPQSVHHPPQQAPSGYVPPAVQPGYAPPGVPTTGPMHHPHPHQYAMSYYYPPPYAAHPPRYSIPQPEETPVPESGQGYPSKPSSRLHLEPGTTPTSHAPTHPQPLPESTDASSRNTPTATAKRRLPFVDPNGTPLDFQRHPSANQADKSAPGSTEVEIHVSSRPSSKPSSPRYNKTEIDKTLAEVLESNNIDRPNRKMVSKVQRTELQRGDPTATRKTASRVPQQLSEPKKFIDPSNGTFRPGSYRTSTAKAVEPPPNPVQVKDTSSSIISGVLRTVESVERHEGEKKTEEGSAATEVKTSPVLKEAKEAPRATPIILNQHIKKPFRASDVVADVLAGTRQVAGNGKPTEVLTVEEKQPKSHPVSVGASLPPSVDTPTEKEKSEEETDPVTEKEAEEAPQPAETMEEKKTELAAIETKRVLTSDSKSETPSKNIYSPSVMQEFREKNKKPLPDMGSGPWLEGSDLDSPSKDRLTRRNSSGKLGSRSNSYQGLSRRNSNSSRATRHSKSDPEEIFHVSSKKRMYTLEFMMNARDQFTEKPQMQENMQCMKDFDGPSLGRSGSDRWSKPGRNAYEDRPKTALHRSGSSGRDWPKEVNRTGGVVVSRRISRQSSSNQRGTDDSKWGKTDINMLSPFAPTSSGVGLHHADNRYVVGEMQTDDPEEEKRQKIFKGVLNKLTPSNFARMYEKFKEVEILDPKTLKGLIDQIFDKALTETTFCPLYSDLCKLLTSEMPEFEEEGDKRKLTFRRLLLNKCQNEFEKGDAAVRAAEEAEAADDSVMSAEERQTRLITAKKERMRSLGNMQFIGFLFKKGMLTERIIHNCIVDLLSEEVNPKPEDIECLCQLLTTVGSLLRTQEEVVDAYFCRIKRLSTSPKLETRHKFMLQDLIEMKDRNWIERREKDGPKKIEEIHRDAQIEQMAQNSRNRGGAGYGGGGYGGRSSRGGGWSRTSSAVARPMATFNSHEEVKPLTKNLSLGRTASSDISLRPSNIGAPKVAVVSMPRPRSRSPTNPPPSQAPIEESASEEQRAAPMEEETLTRKVKSLLAEYYQVKDLEEALRCIEELVAENAQKSDILKNVLLSALDIRFVDVDDRLKPISPLLKELLTRQLFSPQDTKRGLQLTMAALPQAADEFPKAPSLIAKMLGSLVSEAIIPLKPILDPIHGIILGAGREQLQSGEDDTALVDSGYASQVLIDILKQMKSEEEEPLSVRDAVHNEGVDLLLFYPSYLREDTDLSEELQFLETD